MRAVLALSVAYFSWKINVSDMKGVLINVVIDRFFGQTDLVAMGSKNVVNGLSFEV